MKQFGLLIGICVVLSASGCLTQNEGGQVESAPIEQREMGDAQILAVADQKTEVKTFTTQNPDYNYEIVVLNPEDIVRLSEEYPVIYGKLPSKKLYKIQYSSNNKGILVIVDAEDEEILKYFRTTGVSIE